MKKIIYLFVSILFLCSCSSNNIDSVQTYDDSLKFIDDRGYILTLYYSEENIINAEWVIVTEDESSANKLKEYYSDSEEFDVKIDDKTVILDYTESYLDKEFAGITKSDMEEYLKKKGYEILDK